MGCASVDVLPRAARKSSFGVEDLMGNLLQNDAGYHDK